MAVKSADQITIVDVTDAYSVILTSEAYTFVGGTSGATSGSCTTQAVAYCGTEQKNVNVTASDIVCPTGISASVANSGTPAATITFSISSGSTISAACEATIPVVVDGITVNKKFSFAVAKTGATGATGAAGKGIKSTAITYQASSSGTTVPTGTWGTTIPEVSESQYLWTKTVITYTDNSTSTSYSVGMMGAKGDKGDTGATGATGKGVKSSAVTYQASSSGTTAPTGTWSSSIPTLSAGQYLWTKTVITYTDNTTTTSYSVGMKGATGAKGDTGDPGADAITLSITASNGTIFKNSSGSTELVAHVFQGGVEKAINESTGAVADSLGTIKWYEGDTFKNSAGKYAVSASGVSGSLAVTAKLEG